MILHFDNGLMYLYYRCQCGADVRLQIPMGKDTEVTCVVCSDKSIRVSFPETGGYAIMMTGTGEG